MVEISGGALRSLPEEMTERRPALDRDAAVLALYETHYRSLVSMATLLLDASEDAEDVVQEAFVRTYFGRERLKDPAKAAAYLRTTVVNLCRSRLRHRLVAFRRAPKPPPGPADPGDLAVASARAAEVTAALAELPRREREVIVLRYYADLSEAQTAAALGVSTGAVKGYCSRGMAKLANRLKEPSS